MKIKIGSQLLEAQIKDGRFYVTHTFDKDTDHIALLSDCLGNTDFKKIQVEKNPDMTYWVPPEVYEGNISGIFKDLKEINLEMTDTENSKLWSKIKLNALGMLEEYHNETLSAEFIRTAGGI
ncbi:gp58-like family protein, partial [Eremococcus coleocola]|uniref:gp58-like family protein n=1 Tax=Eremococcus coleocola TaxID=88132 RepID=UPI0004842DAF